MSQRTAGSFDADLAIKWEEHPKSDSVHAVQGPAHEARFFMESRGQKKGTGSFYDRI